MNHHHYPNTSISANHLIHPRYFFKKIFCVECFKIYIAYFLEAIMGKLTAILVQILR